MRLPSRRPPALSLTRPPLVSDCPAGYVGLMSANADKLARTAKVHDLHREMKTSVSELVGVTNEIRRGIDPLTVGREMLAARERQASKEAGSSGEREGASERTERPAEGRRVANVATPRAESRLATRVESFSKTNPETSERLERFMPLSAVSVGRLKVSNTEGGDVFGGRVLADALEESAVAAEALRLARSGALDRRVAERAEALKKEGAEVVRDG
jgi:hypothetical protein